MRTLRVTDFCFFAKGNRFGILFVYLRYKEMKSYDGF